MTTEVRHPIRRSRAALSLLGAAACAGGAHGQDSGLEEVIVTAEFRAANVQDTPVAITAVNAAMLEARSQTNIQQVAAQAPNVTLTPGGQSMGHAMVAFIRGVGQTDFNFAMEPGVGIYVDDVYYPNLTGSMVELIDVDRVEIRRGPQGTLAGRNSIGGAVKLFSAEPGADADTGSAQLSVGNFDRIDISGGADITFVQDKLHARIAGVSRSREGYVDRLDYKCLHPESPLPTFSTGDLDGCQLGTLGDVSYTGGRVSLMWTPSDAVHVKIIGDVVNDDSGSAAQILLGVNEATQRTNGWGEGTFFDIDGDLSTTTDRVFYSNAFVTSGPNRGDPVVDSPYVSYATFLDPNQPLPTRPFSPVSVTPRNELDQEGISVAVDWQINDKLAFKSISAIREYDDTWSQDTDGSPLNNQLLTQRVEHDHWTQEFRFSGQAFNDRLDYTAGIFHVDQDGTLEANVNLFYAQLNFIHGPDPTPSESSAVFGHLAWHVSDNLNLTFGVRVTDEEKQYVFRRRNPDGTLPGPCVVPGPPGQLANPNNCALSGIDLLDAEFSDSRGDYRVAVDYHLSDDLMLYGQVSTGFKGGGVNPRPFFPIQIESFEPEELESFEVGVKSKLAGGRARLNAAVFVNDYTDVQLVQDECELPFPPFFGPPCIQPGNVGDADVAGAEVELEIRPIDNLLVDFSASYLDFEYTRVAPTTAVTLNMITPFTPERTWSLGAQYEWPLARGGAITARLDANFQDDVFTDAINAPTNRIEDYTLTNARITWRSAGEDWEAALEVSNLTQEVYFLNIFDQFFSTAGQSAGGIGAPRMVALHLKRNFDL